MPLGLGGDRTRSVDGSGDNGFVFALCGALAALPGIVALRLLSPLVRPLRKDEERPALWSAAARIVASLPLLLFVLVSLLVLPWPGRLVELAVLVVTGLAVFSKDGGPTQVEGTGAGHDEERLARRRQALAQLRARDPGFSRVAFLDFVQALYTTIYASAGRPAFASLRPFLAAETNAELQQRTAGATFEDVVLGSLVFEDVAVREDGDRIIVLVEANVTRQLSGAAPQRYVFRDRLAFDRHAGALSPEPALMRVLSCTHCGAPADFTDAGACRYCAQVFQPGRDQWRLSAFTTLSSETFSTQGLGETVPERGTEEATLFHPELEDQTRSFAETHGLPSFQAFEQEFFPQVAEPVFRQMYAAWSRKAWAEVRHLLGDRLWESQRLWVRAYEAKGYTNKLDDLRLLGVETVRLERDIHFEALTVRLRASCRDYTVDKEGKRVGGSSTRVRTFSEYWTFLRSSQPRERRGTYEQPTCPSCGAGIDRMGEAAQCGYCGAKVSTGDFGWVLTLITQDEVYELDG